jgi:hypothetical protein
VLTVAVVVIVITNTITTIIIVTNTIMTITANTITTTNTIMTIISDRPSGSVLENGGGSHRMQRHGFEEVRG